MANLTPDVLNFDLSTVSGFGTTAAGCYADVLHHPNHVAGVTPYLIWRHGGALAAGDRWACWVNTGTMNAFFSFLFASTNSAFSIISIGTPQYTNAAGTAGTGYLGTITNSTTGVTFLTSPSNVDKFEAALSAAITQFVTGGAQKCVISAASAGCFLAQLAICRTAMSAKVKGYIGYYPIPDVRKIPTPNGGDSLDFSVITGLYGTDTKTAWDAVSGANKNSASTSWQLSQRNKANTFPWFIVYDRTGCHVKPWGQANRPNTAAHDSDQFTGLIDLLGASNIDTTVAIFQGRNFWETQPTPAAVVNAQLETWMLARVA